MVNRRRTTGRRALGTLILVLQAATPAAHAGGPADRPRDAPASPATKNCAFCECTSRYARVLEKATREVGALANGIVVHYHSEDPETVVEIQRYAFERHKLRQTARADAKAIRLCAECRPVMIRLKGANFEVANSVNGVFSLITSSDPEVVRVLHEMASEQTQKSVRGS